MAADTGSCLHGSKLPERSSGRYKEMDGRSAILLREAILGDQNALGELCELYRPSIRNRCLNYLRRIRLESYTEDVTQDAIVEVIKAFPRIDPYRGFLHGLVKTITMHTLYDFTGRNEVMLREMPLPDNDDAAGRSEYKVDPLDSLSCKAWEQDAPSRPSSQTKKVIVRRVGRAATAERKRKAKEKELLARPGSGNYRRDRRKSTAWEMKRIENNRQAFAEALSSTAGSPPWMKGKGERKVNDFAAAERRGDCEH